MKFEYFYLKHLYHGKGLAFFSWLSSILILMFIIVKRGKEDKILLG